MVLRAQVEARRARLPGRGGLREQRSKEMSEKVGFTSNAIKKAKMKISKWAKPKLEGRAVAVEHDMLDRIEALVEQSGTQTALAMELGISMAYLGDVRRGRRPVSENLAKKLGWERMTVFVNNSLGV